MKIFSLYIRRVTTIFVCSCVLLVLSCQKEGTVDPSSVNNESTDPVLSRIRSLGFRENMIVDKGKYYLVDGDIRFNKNPSAKGAKVDQRANSDAPLASIRAVSNITIQVIGADFSNSAWRQRVYTATQNAIASWNNLPYSGVNFVYTPEPATARLQVQLDSSLPAYNYGQTDFPTGCNTGEILRLNNNTQNLTLDQLQFIITHELSHALGFTHTDHQGDNGANSYLVPTTPNNDANSVFNSGIFNNSNSLPSSVPSWSQFGSNFSYYDQTAINYLFPNNASFTATYYQDYSGYPITLNWTPSNFCGTGQVKITVIDDTGTIVKSSNVIANQGVLKMTTSGLVSGGGYEFTIFEVNDPNAYPLSTATSFTFQ